MSIHTKIAPIIKLVTKLVTVMPESTQSRSSSLDMAKDSQFGFIFPRFAGLASRVSPHCLGCEIIVCFALMAETTGAGGIFGFPSQ